MSALFKKKREQTDLKKTYRTVALAEQPTKKMKMYSTASKQ